MTNPAEPVFPAAERAMKRIKAEHLALARIIAAMQAWVVQARERNVTMDFELFAAMMRYIDEVPDRLHHPREDEVLFPAVSEIPGAKAVVAQLEREHARGGPMLDTLRGAYKALQEDAPNALNQLSTAVDEFAEFYWNHMRTEEQTLLPLAAASLDAEQWERIASAFCNNTDPLFGAALTEEYRRLYDYIASRTPEPLKGFVEGAAISHS